jgi:hypothetical protein
VVRDASGLPVQPWEPVLPLGDVERLRALLAPKPAEDRRRRATRLLSGLVVCDGCGGRMRVASTKQRNGRDVLRYACRAKADGRVCPHPTSVTCEGLEGWVEAGFLAVAGDQPMRQPVATIREAPELAEVTAALADLGQAISRPGADVAALAAQIGELHQRRAVLDAVPAEPVVEYVETGLTYAEYWEALDDVAERRDMLRASGYLPVRIKPGQPGRKGLDAKRVVLSDAYRAQGTDFGTWERSRRRGRRARTGG